MIMTTTQMTTTKFLSILLLLALISAKSIEAFATNNNSNNNIHSISKGSNNDVRFSSASAIQINTVVGSSRQATFTRSTQLFATPPQDDSAEDSSSFLNINPLYAGLWAAFLGYGIFFSPGQMADPTDTAIIESFINDPTNAAGNLNPLFFIVFNFLGVMPLVMAQLVLPQDNNARSGKISPLPFCLGAMAAGYGSLGLYLGFLRQSPVDTTNKSETTFITRNVMENKVFNWSMLVLCGSAIFSSGIVSQLGDIGPVVSEYSQLASNSKLVTVSSVDLTILTVVAATLIPRDYRVRTQDDDDDDDADTAAKNANLIAASTVLLPVVGAALYCALRPSLPEE
jgi:hypothetical protein